MNKGEDMFFKNILVCLLPFQRKKLELAGVTHRSQSNNRKGIADVLAMDNLTIVAATRLFCGFSLK
jgi:hypothetical protein